MITDIYTEKQIQVAKQLRKKDWYICILHGAKRSGKTVLNNDLFLQEVLRVKAIATQQGVKQPKYILAGVSSKTIESNILSELTNRYDLEFKFDKHNNFVLFGVKIIQAYTGTISGMKNIRGMTSYGAYINEASLANKKVFTEIISRCSGEGARILADTNPDVPTHYIKTDYIDNASDTILNFHFRLDDNTFLSERYIKSIKDATPSGVFWDRDIEGLWTSGEGVIYKDFNANVHFINYDSVPFDKVTKYFFAVDWGYSHYGVILVFAKTEDGTIYIVDGVAEQFKEVDFFVEKAKYFKDKYKLFNSRSIFYCDSARPEHVARFIREGINAVNADKAVLSGIEVVSKKIKTNKLFVVRNAVPLFEEEIYSYIWDEKSGMPIKMNDDCMDTMRYGIYSEETIQVAKVRNKKDYNIF